MNIVFSIIKANTMVIYIYYLSEKKFGSL